MRSTSEVDQKPRLPTPFERLDFESAWSWLLRYSFNSPLCAFKSLSGPRCTAHYYYGRLEACSGLGGLLEMADVAPKRLQQPLTVDVEGTLCNGRFIADTLVDSSLDDFLVLDRLSFLGFETPTAVCCSSIAEVARFRDSQKELLCSSAEQPVDGIVVRCKSLNGADRYDFVCVL